MMSDAGRYEIVSSDELGLDSGRLGELVERARREIDDGLLPSCQLALAKDGRLALFETLGKAADGSRYVIFSMTKGVVAGAIWILVGERKLSWDQVIADLIPEFGSNGKEKITLEELLTHTSGFPQAPMRPELAATREGRLEQYSRWRLNWEPGTRFEYHPTSAHFVLGDVIETVSGLPAGEFIASRIFDPLGLTAFRLGLPEGEQGDVNTLEVVGELPSPEEIEKIFGVAVDLEEVRGEVTDEALLSFNNPFVRSVGVPGGGGISTAADIALYYQELLHNTHGIWDARVIDEGNVPIVDLPDPLLGHRAHRSRGLMVAGDPPEAQLRGYGHGVSPRTFGHDGAGGQIAWADPDSGISFCYLTNGLDAHIIRQARRTIGLSSRAAASSI